MARSSDATAGWKLSASIAPLAGSSGPFTIVFWFKSGSISQSNKYILHIGASAYQISIIYEYIDNKIEFFSSDHTGDNPRTGSGITIPDTNWHHIAYRKDASGLSNWDNFLDGSKTNNANVNFTLSSSPTSLIMFASTGGNEINAALFDFAIYTVGLADAEIISLSKTFSTRHLNKIPAFGWELWGRNSPEPDIYNSSNNLTVTNVTYIDNPRIIQPFSPFLGFGITELPDVSKTAEPVIEVEVQGTRKLTFPIEAIIEMEATLTRATTLPLSVIIETEVFGTRKLTFPITPLIEMEVSLIRGTKIPLTATVEVEISGERKLKMPLSALIEMEAIGTVAIDLQKSAIATIEVEALGTRKLTLPLSVLMEVEALGTLTITGLEEPVLTFTGKNHLYYFDRLNITYQYTGKDKKFRYNAN